MCSSDLSHSLSLSLSVSLSRCLSLTLSLTLSLSLSLSLSLFLYPYFVSLSFYPSLSHSYFFSIFSPLNLTTIRNGTYPVGVGSVRDSGNTVHLDSTYEGLSDRARSQHSPGPRTPSVSAISPRVGEPDILLGPVPLSTQGQDQTAPPILVRTAHTFGDGTCYPGSRSDLHNTIISELPLSSPLCGLLRDLNFEDIVDLAYMFNYNDDER